MFSIRATSISILLLALCGCAGPGAEDDRLIATDAVCLYNRDLGCVKVRVGADTPHAEYNGQTYFFCGEACRAAFLKEPQKYLASTSASK